MDFCLWAASDNHHVSALKYWYKLGNTEECKSQSITLQ